MEITIKPGRVSAILVTIIAVLATLHISQLVAYYVIADPERFDFIDMLDFDIEANLPSIYSSFAFVLCSAALLMIAHGKRKMQQPYHFQWLLLAFIFLFLGVDEAVSLHEEVGDFMERFITATGYLYFPWVIPYTGLVVLLALFYFRFLLALPRPTMIRFIIAAGIFLSGAVGLEVLSAREADIHGTTSITYSVLYTIEELCEMLGIVIFLQALLEYYAREFGTLQVNFSGKQD